MSDQPIDAATVIAQATAFVAYYADRPDAFRNPVCDDAERYLHDLLTILSQQQAAITRLSGALQWQPMSTLPSRLERYFFWIVPRTADESYTDTSGKPIVGKFEPYRHECAYGSWSALSKAVAWLPLPSPPPPEKT